MNHRYRQAPRRQAVSQNRAAKRVVLVALLLSGLIAPAAVAQRVAPLPQDLRSAANAKPRAAEIEAFVKNQINALQEAKEPAAQQRARDALIREAGGGISPSPSFLEVYATALNKQLVPLAKHDSVRVRLNAAIVLQRVARAANNAQLAEAATVFSQDECIGVALWAMKASQSILPTLATAGAPTKLSGAIFEGARKHATSAEIMDEAYRALTLDLNTRVLTERATPVVAQDVLRLFTFRVGQYLKRAPPRPDLEIRGVNFLTLGTVWNGKETSKLQPQIAQQLVNLVGASSQHAMARPETERRVFVEQLRGIGDALIVLGRKTDLKGAGFSNAGKALAELQLSTPEDVVNERVAAAFDAIKSRFPKLKPAPEISADATAEPKEEIAESSDVGSVPGGAEAAVDETTDSAGSGSGSRSSGGTSAGSGSRSSGGTGAGSTGGTRTGTGEGRGAGTGTGEGRGAGTGTGSGTGTGTGSGTGTGTGSGTGGGTTGSGRPPTSPPR